MSGQRLYGGKVQINSSLTLTTFGILVLCSCSRTDTLSVTANTRGEGVIIDALSGPSDRIICVEESVNSGCHRRNAVLVVKNAPGVTDVVAEWRDGTHVDIHVRTGRVLERRASHLQGVSITVRLQ